MKPATKTAIAKYGIEVCVKAHEMHEQGNGASTVSHSFVTLNGNTRSADAAINAGREIKNKSI